MNLIVHECNAGSPRHHDVEVVERKGLGHPDTICDAIAEKVCVRLCRHYLDHFGAILHHNVDKVLLCGGAARPRFGGGEMLEPIEIYLAGRATVEHAGQKIPVHDIAIEACRDWLREHMRGLDAVRNVRVFSRLRPGSSNLTGLFARNRVPLANDTSCGAGFAPLTDLESVVLAVERALNSPRTKEAHPCIGEDIKVMGVRQAERIELTIGCAFVDRFVANLEDYRRKKGIARALAESAARDAAPLAVAASLNMADDFDRGDVYLTVTGTSAEAGDDGEVGRGNRTSGLITPYRRMTLEAAAGKNPVSHVGKLYNLLAHRICAALAGEVPGLAGASCVIVSQIGRRVDDPGVMDLEVELADGPLGKTLLLAIQEVVRDQLGHLDALRQDVLQERVALF